MVVVVCAQSIVWHTNIIMMKADNFLNTLIVFFIPPYNTVTAPFILNMIPSLSMYLIV